MGSSGQVSWRICTTLDQKEFQKVCFRLTIFSITNGFSCLLNFASIFDMFRPEVPSTRPAQVQQSD